MSLDLSGERIRATYRLTTSEPEALAEAICVEQTVEFPPEFIGRQDILDGIIGQVEHLEASEAVISYPAEAAGAEVPQLLNLLFGNVSLVPGVRLVSVQLPASVRAWLPGPGFGIEGLRRLTGAVGRPLLASALKPMGLSPRELASLARDLARGGLDLIKDDHGLAHQPFCSFEERVKRAAASIREADPTCLYAPHLTGPAHRLLERAELARDAGAGALMVCPGLVGWDVLRLLREEIGLPLLCHPAALGSAVVSRAQGVEHGLLLGTLPRWLGADVTIFPNHGGRFTFTPAECQGIAAACTSPDPSFAPMLPAPAGGMRLERVPDMLDLYGQDVVLLIGGDLHRGGDLVERCRAFRELVG